MKVLLAHNYYGSSAPSGENTVFDLEKVILERNGHEVRPFVRHSDELRGAGLFGMAKGALTTPWNPSTARAMKRLVDEFRPDVVHVHNTFPLISPSVFLAIGRRAARVLTLHNYRLFCPSAIPLRDGLTCTECLDRRSVLPSLRHGCYRGSRVATLPLALSVALNRALRLWDRHVDAFIALSDFQRDLMVRAGLPSERVFVKPNFYPGAPEVVPPSERRDRVVFAGRLSAEKGVENLVDAWVRWGDAAPELRVVGDGPRRNHLEDRAGAGRKRITFLGQVSRSVAEAEIAGAKLVILPSLCFEGFPMVLREAFAFGTPAAVSDIGPLPDIVGRGHAGVVFAPGDASSLLEAVRELWSSPERLHAMAARARLEFQAKYSEAANLRTLLGIYDEARTRTREANLRA